MNDRLPPEDEIERLRNDYLRLRNALYDRTTGLPAYPVHFGALRTLLDARRHLGVIHVEARNLALLESLYGWQAFDRVIARLSEAVREAVGEGLPGGTLLAVDGVPAERFVAFVPADAAGREPDSAWLADAARGIEVRLERALGDDDALAGLSPGVVFEAGHALLSENPFYRFERRVHAAVAEARALHAGRQRRRGRMAESELRRIIRDGSITTLFQPVVEMATGGVIGYEALSRGPSRSRFESPRELFALSGRLGASRDLDRACRTAALRRYAAGLRGRIFLNVLPDALGDPEWTEGSVGSLLAENGRAAGDVVIEVSERSLEGDLEPVAAACRALRERGFRLALDDAGTGYASLVTVETLRPDFLKIDASLVRGIDGSLILQEVVGSLARIGARVGARVVGVGVERQEEAACLSSVGASLAQGFLYAVPAPAETWAEGRASP